MDGAMISFTLERSFSIFAIVCLFTARFSVGAFQLSRENTGASYTPSTVLMGTQQQRQWQPIRTNMFSTALRSVDNEIENETLEFVTPFTTVFIEDTDAYGVMYNANYLRAYDRALHTISASRQNADTSRQRTDNTSPNSNSNDSSVLDHEGWSLVEVNNQKFKGSPPLGGKFVVTGRRIKSDNNRIEVWDLKMQTFSQDSQQQEEQEQDAINDKATVYNTATVTIAQPDVFSSMGVPNAEPFVQPVAAGSIGSPVAAEYSFTLYRDEFDMHLPTHLPLRNVLNLFERARSNFLGGPDMLRKMQEEENLLAVVTGNDQCSLINLLGYNNGSNDRKSGGVGNIKCRPGQLVTVKTTFESKRGGMVIICKHTLLLPESPRQKDGASGRRRIAQGIVTLMSINNSTRRPTKHIPTFLRDKLEGNRHPDTDT